jgi:SAM-dependent methyltransferase
LARADGQQLPFAAATFDFVFSLGVVEHFEDPGPLLREQFRVLRDGGTVLASVPNIGPGTLHGWHWRHFRRALYRMHVAYTPAQLRDVLTSVGFVDVATIQTGLYLPHMQRVLRRTLPRSLLRHLELPALSGNLIASARKSPRDPS